MQLLDYIIWIFKKMIVVVIEIIVLKLKPNSVKIELILLASTRL